MAIVRRSMMGVGVLGSMAVLSAVACAHEEHTQADITLLREAAAVLKASRPDLAQGLSTYADREANEWDEMNKEQQEKEEVGEQREPQDEQGEQAPHH